MAGDNFCSLPWVRMNLPTSDVKEGPVYGFCHPPTGEEQPQLCILQVTELRLYGSYMKVWSR